jgi:membrane-associated phospholipid phosphatase
VATVLWFSYMRNFILSTIPSLLLLAPASIFSADQAPLAPAFDVQFAQASTQNESPEMQHDAQFWFGKRVVVDTWSIISSPFDWSGTEWAIAGAAVSGTVATGLFVDQQFQSESQESRNPDKDRWSGAWGQLGTFYSLAALGAAGAYGWAADDDRSVNAMIDGLEASIISSGILCPIIKYGVGRRRPNRSGQDSDEFSPFGGNVSFPSGHTTQAFTVASVLAFSYDDQPLVGGVAFALASGVGLSRINDDMHYASDVVAGAILGTLVGYEVVHYNRRRRGEEIPRSRAITDASVDLIFDSTRKGISLTWHW